MSQHLKDVSAVKARVEEQGQYVVHLRGEIKATGEAQQKHIAIAQKAQAPHDAQLAEMRGRRE